MNKNRDSIKKFTKEFEANLADTSRWPAFELIAGRLLSLGRPAFIVETGCLRTKGNWAGDGQSTQVYNWIAEKTGGSCISIDVSEESINEAKRAVPGAKLVLGDSISTLRRISDPQSIDLLYLDSMDVTGSWDSPLHHIGELASIYANLKSGCLIAVDDCTFAMGKHRYVSMFFSDIGIEPIYSGYITVWEKP